MKNMKTEKTKIVRFAQLGCNGVAHEHAAAHRWTGNTELKVVCDLDGDKAKAFAEKHGVPVWTSNSADVFARDDIDAVDIVTSDHTHAMLSIAAVKAGKHVLVEKPLATTVEDADAVISAAAENDVRLMCAQCMRWDPRCRAITEKVKAGAVGRPVFVRIHGGCPPFWQPGNWPEAASGGKPDFLLFREGVHWMDWITALLGEFPESVHVVGHPGQEGVPLWEYFAVNMRFPSGALGLGESNRIVQPPGYPTPGTGVYLVGTEGTLALENTTDLAVSLHTADGISFPGSHVYAAPMDSKFAAEIRHFADCVITGAEPEVSPRHSRRVIQAILAAQESFRRGEPVEVTYV